MAYLLGSTNNPGQDERPSATGQIHSVHTKCLICMRTAVTGLDGPSDKCHSESPETTPNSSEKLRQIILKATVLARRERCHAIRASLCAVATINTFRGTLVSSELIHAPIAIRSLFDRNTTARAP